MRKTTTPTSSHAAQKRRMVEAAIKLMRRKGFDATTLGEIAAAANISEPAFYHYFSSKGHLFLEISNLYCELIDKELERILSLSLPADKRLERIVSQFVHLIARNANILDVMLQQRNMLPRKEYARLVERERRYLLMIHECYEEGMRGGAFWEADSKIMSLLILGASLSIVRWYDPKGKLKPEQIASMILRLISAGYLTAAPSGANLSTNRTPASLPADHQGSEEALSTASEVAPKRHR